MKSILSITLLLFTLLVQSQQDHRLTKIVKDLNPEQRAILKTKKMTLALDLNENQTSQMMDLNKSWSIDHHREIQEFINSDQEGLSVDQKFERMDNFLDQKIIYQRKVAQILDEEQYQSWKKIQQRKSKFRRGKSERNFYKKNHKSN